VTPLPDPVTVRGAGGAFLGAAVGLVMPARGLRAVAENIALGAALGFLIRLGDA
jgi:hypothetical protein